MHYRTLEGMFGKSYYARVDAPANPAQKAVLSSLNANSITATEMAGEQINAKLTHAPCNQAAIGGLKVVTDEFFKARAEWGRAGQVLQRQAIDFADALKLVSESGGMDSAKELAWMMATLSPEQQARFAHNAGKKSVGDNLWSLWYSFMLSNPKTHIVNFTSIAAYNQWLGLDRLVAAGLGKLHTGDKVYFREMVPTLQGQGLHMIGAWHTAYGEYPLRLTGFLAPDEATMEAVLASPTFEQLEARLTGVANRKQGRSKYGAKRPK